MRELSVNELGTVSGGSSTLTYPGVYVQELPVKMNSIPGVSTSTGERSYSYQHAKMIGR